MSSPASPEPRLFWSKDGRVLCERHARELPDGEFARNEWKPLKPSAPGNPPRRYQCERCHGRPIRVTHDPE